MISIVIPCFNESAVLPQLVARVEAAATTWDVDHEVILVDDGSTDDTWKQIQRCQRRLPHWKGIRLARNFGQQAAIGAGLHAAKGAAVVILDADLQDPPELVADFVAHWRQGAEVVYGIRTDRPEAWWKRCCYRAFYWLLQRLADCPIPLDAGDFCLMDRRVVAALKACQEQRPFWRGLRAWVGFRHVGVPYARHSRQAGASQYTLRKLFQLAWDGLGSLTQLTTLVLWTLVAVACMGLATTAVAQLTSGTGPGNWGWMLLGTLQLLALAILGGQQQRVLDEVRRRPRWLVSARVGMARRRCDRMPPRGPRTWDPGRRVSA